MLETKTNLSSVKGSFMKESGGICCENKEILGK